MYQLVVLGGGESGVGTALLAKEKGMSVFLSDSGKIADKYIQELKEHQIPFEENQHSEALILSASEIMKSPGIPHKATIIQAANQKGISVISEMEFATRFVKGKILGITGSNGKTTTTYLCDHLLTVAGISHVLGGNVGVSFARGVYQHPDCPLFVLEISSFQLDDISSFRPDVAILLNITPDHLDRYQYKFEKYVASKFNITKFQTANDWLIYNGEDAASFEFLKNNSIAAKTVIIQGDETTTQIWKASDGFLFDFTNTNLKGPHNRFNGICALTACKLLGADNQALQKGLETFKSVPHRLEKVATIKGVDYINDSKATNVDAVFYALKAMEKPTILILGGQDKGNDYSAILELVQEKVKAIVAMGVDNQKIIDYFGNKKIVKDTHSPEEAVSVCENLADNGDVVLLSPACASFDLFKNYEHRGECFKNLVHQIQKKYESNQ